MTTHIILAAPDISCAHCVATVKETVGELVGIESVDASESTKLISVAYDPDKIEVAGITAALSDAGYPATQQ